MFAPSHTILLITSQVSARIDLAGKRRAKVKQIWSLPSVGYEDLLPNAVRALKLGPRPGLLTVVSPDFWTGILSVPSDVLAIAGEAEILQALAIEAEAESGLLAFDSHTGAVELSRLDGGDQSFCVTQLSHAQLHEFSQLATSNGTTLFGAAHPVAASLFDTNGVTIDGASELLESWRIATSTHLEQLDAFAAAWSKTIGQHPRCPLIIGNPASATTVQPIGWTASLALLAFGGCGLWHWQAQQCLASATQAIERLEKKQSQHDSTDAALKVAEAQLQKLRSDVAKAQTLRQSTERQLDVATSVHAKHNRRWIALINAMSETSDGTCWVQKIESNSAQTIAHGVALDNAAANRFAGQLEILLRDSGWQVMPASTKIASNNLIEFQIVLRAKRKPSDSDRVTPITMNPAAAPLPAAQNSLLAKGDES